MKGISPSERTVRFYRVDHVSAGVVAPAPTGMRYDTFDAYAKRNWWHPSRLVQAGGVQHFVYARATAHLFLTRDSDIRHRSVVHARDFRFPFMAPPDLMVGAVWTAPTARAQGLATLMLRRILSSTACSGSFWYVTAADNPASIRAAERAGFVCVGRGIKVPRLGRGELGSYEITGSSE